MLRYIELFAKSCAIVALTTSFSSHANWVKQTFVKLLPEYTPYQTCIVEAGHRFGVKTELMLAVLMQENGLKALVQRNNDGSLDLGIYQINTVRIPELKAFEASKEEIAGNHCLNANIAAYLLSEEIAKAPSFWTGVGNYHYGYWGKYPHNHTKYIENVYQNWKRIVKNN